MSSPRRNLSIENNTASRRSFSVETNLNAIFGHKKPKNCISGQHRLPTPSGKLRNSYDNNNPPPSERHVISSCGFLEL